MSDSDTINLAAACVNLSRRNLYSLRRSIDNILIGLDTKQVCSDDGIHRVHEHQHLIMWEDITNPANEEAFAIPVHIDCHGYSDNNGGGTGGGTGGTGSGGGGGGGGGGGF